MEQKDIRDIVRIMGRLNCTKNFKCYREGFRSLCKAQDIGLETFLECLEEDPDECPFSMPLGGTIYCRCPLRIHLLKKLKK
ncbi:MAG: hypothetical protein JRE24_01425 [Deltaproteobacteria bacterium]|nr:hypothetical protein [Deltaproteobacteria bacterium]MBW2565545.1 hypothetical protein [Deltaproteobacteria bacterium]